MHRESRKVATICRTDGKRVGTAGDSPSQWIQLSTVSWSSTTYGSSTTPVELRRMTQGRTSWIIPIKKQATKRMACQRSRSIDRPFSANDGMLINNCSCQQAVIVGFHIDFFPSLSFALMFKALFDVNLMLPVLILLILGVFYTVSFCVRPSLYVLLSPYLHY